MAKIHIENGIISSSADYSLYHGTSPLATIEAGGFRVQGDIIAENMIVSSSTTYMTTSFSSGNTVFGDTSDDTHRFTGSLFVSASTQSTINDIDISKDGNHRTISKGGGAGAFNFTNTGQNHDIRFKVNSGGTTATAMEIDGLTKALLPGSDNGMNLGASGTKWHHVHATNFTAYGGNISGSATSTGSFGAGYIDNKLGIGTLVPTEKLHIVGELAIEETSATSGLIKFRDTDQAVLGQIGIARTTNDIGSNSANLDMVYRLEYNNKFMWNQQNTTRMVLNEHGLGINATPADDIRLRVGASDNDDGIRLDDQSGNQLFKVFQQSDGVGRLFVGGSSSGIVFNVTGGADASYVKTGRFGVGVTSPTTELDVSGSLQVSGKISGSSTSTGSFGNLAVLDSPLPTKMGSNAINISTDGVTSRNNIAKSNQSKGKIGMNMDRGGGIWAEG